MSLELTAAHVRRSLDQDGQGNTQLCAMAVCSTDHGGAFPHPFYFVDWVYKRAYFVNKVKNGLPVECVVYQHNDDVAPQFDNPTAMRKLLRDLETRGPRIIKLYPPKPRKRDQSGRVQEGRLTGERKRPFQPRGANLRFAQLQLGATSPSKQLG